MAPLSHLQDLVDAWWQHPEWQPRHLARNMALDCPSLVDPGHPDFAACGDRLDATAENQVNDSVANVGTGLEDAEKASSTWELAWGNMTRILADEGRRLRGRTPPLPGQDPGVGLIRYIDCNSVFHHWLYPRSSARRAEIRTAIETLLQRSQDYHRWSSGTPAATALMGAPGSVFWITPDDPAPHRRPEVLALPEEERALAVARLMGLSGYEEETARRRKVGLIAATCNVDRSDLLIPTILHAFDNPYFFPGRKNENMGRVGSLDDNLQSPWQRNADNSQIAEWVYENVPLAVAQPDLELVGFFEN